MDGLTLLQRARDAGLRLETTNTSLKITGPRNADALVRLLAEHKMQVLEALRKVQEVQKAAGTEDDGAEHDGRPYASALAALRAKCPVYVPEDRWQQAVDDGRQFLVEWGTRATAFGWTMPELFGLHPVPEQSAPNCDRLARLDDLGLLWLLRGRPVIAVTSTEAIMRCPSGATLKFYRRTEPAQAGIGYLMQIVKPRIIDDAPETAAISEGAKA